MVRDSTSNAGAAMGTVGVTPAGALTFFYRGTDNNPVLHTTYSSSVSGPVWLRLTQSGLSVSASFSKDGVTFTPIDTESVSLGSNFFAGYTVCSNVSGTASTATFSNVTYQSATYSGANWPASNVFQANIGSSSSGSYVPNTYGTYSTPGYTVLGSGAGIGGSSDSFSFVNTQATSLSTFTALIQNVSPNAPNGFAGLMVRDSNSTSNTGAAMGTVGVTAGGVVQFTYRLTDGTAASTWVGPTVTGPVWVRLTQGGSGFSAFQSTDGVNFTQVGSTENISVGSSFFAGYAVSSSVSGTLTTATFGQVSYLGGAWPMIAGTFAVNQSDIGSPGAAGTYSSDTYCVSSPGTGLGGLADSFTYVSGPANAVSTFTTCVTSQTNTNTNAFAGLMLRDSITSGGSMVSLGVTPGSGVQFITRSTDGAQSTTVTQAGSAVSAPTWLRLVQSGGLIYGYQSSDSVNWNFVSSLANPMPASYFAGLAVTSNASGVSSSASFTGLNLAQQWNFTQTDITGGSSPTLAFTQNGVGTGIAGASDSISYVSIPTNQANTPITLIAQVTPQTVTNATAGIAMRHTLAVGSAEAAVVVSGSTPHTVNLIYRTSDGGMIATPIPGSNVTAAVYLRLIYDGTTNFTASQSNDGSTYSPIGSVSISAMQNTTFDVGLVTSSASTGPPLAGFFANVTFGAPSTVFGFEGVNNRTDIGAAAPSGSYTQTWAMPSSGTSIGSNSDSCTFNYVPMTGNIELTANITSQSGTTPNAGSGLMVRDSVNASGAGAFIGVTTGNGLNFVLRSADGATSTTSLGPSILAPVWVRLVLSGSSVAGYQSSDGLNWSIVGSGTLSLPTIYLAGAASSGGSAPASFANFLCSTSVPQRSPSLFSWLRTDSGLQYSGTTVTNWADQSGNGSNGQPQGSPTFSSGQLNNNVPAISLNGSSQYLSLPATSAFGATPAVGCSIFALAQPTGTLTAGKRFIDFGSGTTTNSFNLEEGTVVSGTSALSFVNFNSSTGITATTPTSFVSPGVFQLAEAVFDGVSTATAYVNGQPGTTNSAMNAMVNTNRSKNSIGSFANGTSNFFLGQMAEVLIYNAPVSNALRGQIESYIYSKTGVGNQPTLDTPVITPGYGVFATGISAVTITQDQGAPVWYTTDGTNPLSSATAVLYTAPFPVNQTTTVLAIAQAPNFHNSQTGTANLIFEPSSPVLAQLGLTLWLRADTGVVTNGGSNVVTWGDMSGNNNTATASATPPTLQANQFNGLPIINFAGTNQAFTLPSGFGTFNGVTIFAVLQPTTFVTDARFIDLGNGGTSDDIIFQENTSQKMSFQVYNGATQSIISTGTVLNNTSPQLIDAKQDGVGTGTIYLNGTSVASGTVSSPNSLPRTTNYVGRGSSFFYNGKLAEMIVFNTALSDAQRQSIEAYLASRYALYVPTPAISPPTGMYAMTPQTVTISAAPGAVVNYTIDGTDPTIPGGSAVTYAGPFQLSQSATIRAYATQPFGSPSATALSAIAIDPSAGNIPSSGLLMWLRSDVGPLKGSGTPAPINTWVDLSSAANNATAGTVVPTFADHTLNNLPSINFVASGGTPASFTLPTFGSLTAGASVFMTNQPGNNGPWLDLRQNSGTNNLEVQFLTTTNPATEADFATSSSTGALTQTIGAVPPNIYTLAEGVHNGAAVATVYVNGGQVAQNSAMNNMGTGSRTYNHIFGPFDSAPIAEQLLYSRGLSNSERQVIEAYQVQRYQLLFPYPPLAPSLYPASGTHFSGSLLLAITAPTNAVIHYTTNGTTPTSSSPTYSGPITITSTTTVKAIAILQGFTTGVTSATYTLP